MIIEDVIVTTEEDSNITVEEIENLRMAYSTPKGCIPLMRSAGIDYSIAGLPLNVAEVLFSAEIYRLTEEYSNGIEVSDITVFLGNEDGKLKAKVVVSRGE